MAQVVSPFCVEWKEVIFYTLRPQFSVLIGKHPDIQDGFMLCCSALVLWSVCTSSSFCTHIALQSSCSSSSAAEAAIFSLGCMYLRTYWIHWACGKDMGIPPAGCSVLFTSRPLPLLCLLSVETSCMLSDKVLLILRSHLKPHFFQEASSETSECEVTKPPPYPPWHSVSHIHHFVSQLPLPIVTCKAPVSNPVPGSDMGWTNVDRMWKEETFINF